MKKKVLVLMLIFISTGTLFAQGEKKGRSLFVYGSLPNGGYFEASSTDSSSDLVATTFFSGLAGGVGMRFSPIVELSGGLVFNYQFGLSGDDESLSGISGGWDFGLQSKVTLYPEIWISPYLKFEIGYDNIAQVSVDLISPLGGFRYMLVGGISLGGETTRLYIEGGLLAKTNFSGLEDAVSIEQAITGDDVDVNMPNVQDVLGWVVNAGFEYYFDI